MAFENIQQAVLDSAQKEADRILTAARKSAQERLAAGLEVLRRDAERRYGAETRAIEDDFARRIVQYKGNAGKLLLERRNAVLRRIFETARAEILEAPGDLYESTMRRLLERASEGSAGRVRVHESDVPMFRAMIEQLNSGRPESEQIRLDEHEFLASRGGFVFITDAYEVDQTLDTIFADLEHELSPGLAAELFASDDAS